LASFRSAMSLDRWNWLWKACFENF